MADPPEAQLMDGAASPARSLQRADCVRRHLPNERGGRPCLAAVLVGSDPSSATYVKMKQSDVSRRGSNRW